MGKKVQIFCPSTATAAPVVGECKQVPPLDERQEETVAYKRVASPAHERVTSTTMTANQVVAYNMAKARALRGWTQERVGEELAPYLGVKLSVQNISAKERSAWRSEPIRVFSADDLVALSRGFDLPVGFFLVPPPPARGIRLRSATTEEDPLVLLDAVLGTADNLAEWEQALFECSAAMVPAPVAEWLRAHVARSASAFGGLVELAEQCRRMVRVLEELDVVCPSDVRD